MCRAAASRSAMACSAALTMFEVGAFTTKPPRAVAAGTSTLSSPIPARATTFSRGAAASASASIWVAERMSTAEASARAGSRAARSAPSTWRISTSLPSTSRTLGASSSAIRTTGAVVVTGGQRRQAVAVADPRCPGVPLDGRRRSWGPACPAPGAPPTWPGTPVPPARAEEIMSSDPDGQPEYGQYRPAPQYGPQYGQPQYGQSPYGPQYGPQYGQPAYGQHQPTVPYGPAPYEQPARPGTVITAAVLGLV